MTPRLEREVLPGNDPTTRFVRQGREVHFDISLTHKQIVLFNDLKRGVSEDGRLLVSDGGFIVSNSRTGEIELFGDTSSCVVDDDVEVAREKTVETIKEITGRETEHLFW